MKANEIRVGNWFIDPETGSYHQIEQICTHRIGSDLIGVVYRNRSNWCSLDGIDPVPLSEEWLIKAGFEKREAGVCFQWWNGINEITHDWLVDLVQMKDNGQIFYRNGKHTLKYVHQLQNLVYALTGEELEFKL